MKYLNKVNWPALWEAVKEPLRLLLLAVISFVLVELAKVEAEWAFALILVLRFVDKALHEVGKSEDKPIMAGGLTRF